MRLRPGKAMARSLRSTALASSVAFLAAWAGSLTGQEPPSPSPTPIGASSGSCAALGSAAFRSYRDLLGRAATAARADASRNGSTGAYGIAATNARKLLQRAHDKATEILKWQESRNGRLARATLSSEADQLKAYLRPILETLPEAAHWATISAAYHKSDEARQAFEGTIAAIDRGNELMGEAGRCFLSAYF